MRALDQIYAIMAPMLVFLVCLCVVWPVGFGQQAGNGYRLTSIEEGPDGSLLGSLEIIKSTNTYGPDIPHLQLYVRHETEDRLRVHITDAENKRWEVPQYLIPREQAPYALKANPNAIADGKPVFDYAEFSSSELIFSCTSDPFGFAIKRNSNGDVLFNTTASPQSAYGNLVFKDQYLEITTSLPTTASLYGLGENTQPNGIRLVPNEPYTLFTTDVSAINLNTDLYGSHPVYLDVRSGGVAHGVLLLNGNGMDIFYSASHLTYKVIGGVLDFYFFAGPSPLSVVQQYTSLIGRPAAMPYWAFGFHQCRWGYKNVSDIESVVAGYSRSKIPLDVLWNDDDHMDGAKDFTLDPLNYPEQKLRPFIDRLHANGQRYVVLIDPGISVNSSYGTFQRGMAADVFIKHEGRPYLGQVWPGPVYFPDYLNPKTVSFWSDEISRFHKMVPVDGLWIDMNEVSNFCTGKCTVPTNRKCPGTTGQPWDCCLDCTNITDTKWDVPPYRINASGVRAPLGQKTIATSAVHHGGVLEYNAHSLYGLSEAIATHKALADVRKKRPFVLTRSTFVGSGSHAAHWTGDNEATWEHLRYSISTILNFGMFGVPMVGADICGFYLDTTEELCNRWIQLGAFYPFSRDHAFIYSSRQELYLWDSVAKSARKALGLRYRLLPYLYTLNYEAHVTGAPIARPLFFSFPDDPETYGLSKQFLLGEGVLVSPVLQKGATSVDAYFPRGSWYNLFDMSKALKSSHGQYVTLDAPLDTVNVHVHEGVILPTQRGGLTSTEARLTPFTLVVAFPLGYEASGGKAKGELFLDGGEDLEMKIEDGKSTYVEFYAESDGKTVRVRSDVEMGDYATQMGWTVERLVVLGLSSNGKEFVLEALGNTHSSYFLPSASVRLGDSDENNVVLEIKGLALPIGRSFDLSWALNPKTP